MTHRCRVDVYVNSKLYAPSDQDRGMREAATSAKAGHRRVAKRNQTRRTVMSVQEIAEKMKSRVASAGFEHSVKFDTGSDGVIVIDGASVSTTDAPTDCTVKLSLDDLESLIAGDLNPTMAFMSGKIKIEGDMTVAMALSQVLG
jgi:putative sterol carrier protein